MKIITVINAKGGCGKSTMAMSLAAAFSTGGLRTLLIDTDPQAQVTQWLKLGDGLSSAGTLVAAIDGTATLDELVQDTAFESLRFIASSQQLEDVGRQITDHEGYQSRLAQLLAGLTETFDVVVIDSPNQISPVMENCIFPTDVFVVPFESTKAVRSYANFYQLLLKVRPERDYQLMHVLSNLSRQPGLRRRVIDMLDEYAVPRARTEIRTCGWLAQVDENGGNIFEYRPHSKGAEDMAALAAEVIDTLPPQNPFQPMAASAAPVASDTSATAAADTHYPIVNDTNHDQIA